MLLLAIIELGRCGSGGSVGGGFTAQGPEKIVL